MDELNSNSKKIKRLESKKKKAAAFLALVGHKMSGEVRKETRAPGSEGNNTSDDILLEMKKLVWERKKQAMQKPKVFLTLEAMLQFRAVPDEPVTEEELPPLYVMDLQQLLLYGIQGNSASYKPRWCKLLRVGKVSSVVLLMLDGLSYNDYTQNKRNFPFISQNFESYVEMVCPRQYMQTVDRELYNVPLSVSQLKKVNVKVPKKIRDSVVAKIAQPVGNAKSEKFSRTCLLLSTYQMMLESYPLPVHTNIGRYRDFVFTKDKYEAVTAKSPLFALDCEMCTTVAKKNELTRVSIVSEDGDVIYDTLVKPKNRIINYLTRFSGITKEMLEPVKTTLEDVQREIRRILPADAILCGQSLNGDLMALKMFHPYVIDTSVIFNMSGNRGVKAGLRKLSQFFLGRSIQDSCKGHNSTEDASATLDLVKLKLSQGLEYGDATLSGVYFPDIHTYFTAGGSTASGVIENVEKDAVEDTQSVISKQKLSVESDSSDICRTSCSNNQDSAPVTDKGVGCTSCVQNLKKQTVSTHCICSVKTSAIHSDVPFHKSSSSSSSSEDERDEVVRENAGRDDEGPPAKKARPDSSVEQRESGSVGSLGETPEVDSSDRGVHGDPVTKCSDFLFTSTTDLVEEQKFCLFSQANSVHVSHSFFRLIYEAGRSGCMIDQEAVISKYTAEPIETVVVSGDTQVRRSAKAMVQSKEFVWANFRGFSDEMEQATQSRKEKLMRKLDNRVRSVMKHVRQNALVVVVMTGRESDDIPQNMATFLTTT